MPRGARLALAVLPLVFTGKAFLIGGVYGPVDLYYGHDPWKRTAQAQAIGPARNPILSDVAFANIPWRSTVRESLVNGRIPFWNRFVLAGSPIFPAAGDSFLHPAAWLGIFLPVEPSFLFSCAFTLFLALLCGFLFFRDHDLSPAPALVGAVAWGFSTCLLFWNGFAIGPTIATFPLLLVSLRRLARQPGAASVALAVIALLLGIAGGHPESFFHCLAGGAVYFVWEIASRPRRVIRPLGAALLAGFLALLLAAPLLLPLLDALPRTAIYGARQRQGQSVSAPESARRLLPALLPFAHGIYGRSPVQDWRHDGSGMPMAYSGALLFPLALLAFRAPRGERRGRILFLVFYLAGLGYGVSAPVLSDVTSALPGFDIALNYRMVFLAPLGLAGLTALGAEEIRRNPGRSIAIAAAAVLALLVVSFVFSRGVFEGRGLPESFVRVSFAAQILPLAVLAAAALLRPLAGTRLVGAALLLLVAERLAEMSGVYPTLPAGAAAPPLRVLESLPRGGEPYRIVARADVLRPNAATLYGLEDVRGYEPFVLADLAETFPLWCQPQHASYTIVEGLTRPFLSLLNARFAIASPDDPAPAGWLEGGRDAEMAIFENPRALNRVFVPRRVRLEPDRQARIVQMAREADFGERAWLSDPDGEISARGEVPNGQAQLSLRSSGPDLLITATAASRVLLATSIPAWPGWNAETATGRLPIVRVNHAFVGFRLEPGRHEVRLHYRPPLLDAALGACLAGILLAAVLGILAAIRSRQCVPTARGT
ncbi:MAG TPA: YfhO family protein [Thermoanaerobaculia bacterium]|nr:YfhO family protein [Thermoanaerobaculia bacterium]